MNVCVLKRRRLGFEVPELSLAAWHIVQPYEKKPSVFISLRQFLQERQI